MNLTFDKTDDDKRYNGFVLWGTLDAQNCSADGLILSVFIFNWSFDSSYSVKYGFDF